MLDNITPQGRTGMLSLCWRRHFSEFLFSVCVVLSSCICVCLTCCLFAQLSMPRPAFGTSLRLVKLAHCFTYPSILLFFLLPSLCHMSRSTSSTCTTSTATTFTSRPLSNPHTFSNALPNLLLSNTQTHNPSLTQNGHYPKTSPVWRQREQSNQSNLILRCFSVTSSSPSSYHEVQWFPTPGPGGGPGDFPHTGDGWPKVRAVWRDSPQHRERCK